MQEKNEADYSNAHLAPHYHESVMCISLHVYFTIFIQGCACGTEPMMSDPAETQEREDRIVTALESPLCKYSKWFDLQNLMAYAQSMQSYRA